MTAFRDGSSADGAASGLLLPVPSSFQTGDLAILGIGVISATAVISSPGAGWTMIGARQQDAAFTCGFWYKVMTSGDLGSTLTLAYTGDTGQAMNAIIAAWSGAAATSPLDSPAIFHDTSTGTAHIAQSLTPGQSGEIVFVMELERGNAHATAFTSSAGSTMRVADLPAGAGANSPQGCVVDSGTAAPSGLPSAGWTITSTATSFGHAFMLAAGILPAASTQTVRPISDVTVTSWVKIGAASTFAGVTSDTDDTTYAESAAAPSGQVIEEKLATPAAVIASVDVRARVSGGATSGSMTVSLVQGATVLQSWTQPGLTTTFTDYVFTVTGAGLTGQTDLTNLRIRVAVTAS